MTLFGDKRKQQKEDHKKLVKKMSNTKGAKASRAKRKGGERSET